MRAVDEPNLVQIIGRDNVKNILVILTWDFEKNMEFSIYTCKSYLNEKPELFVVKGLNERKNYLINSNQIFDLESNIPIQSTERNFYV